MTTKTHTIRCRECDATVEASRSHKKFCDNACKTTFHNRAQKRGKELYHLFMNKRFDRQGGFNEKVAREAMDALASGYREADVRARGGRKSWFTVEEALEELGRLPGCPDGR